MRLLVTVLFGSLSSLTAAELTIAGSSTVYPVVNEAAKTYAAAKITVGQGGSSDGIKKVANGTITIAMSSRALKEAEVAQGLVATDIGKDGIALICNKGNAVVGLTTEQARGAFTGTIANWSALGGGDAAIVLVSLNEQHGTTDGFAHFFGLQFKGDGEAKTMAFALKDGTYGKVTALRTATPQETAAKVATNPAGLGFASIGTIEALVAKGTPIKALTLDGKTPSTATVKDGTWPATRPLLLITKGAPSADAKAFIDFMLSDAGQELIVKNGFVGVK